MKKRRKGLSLQIITVFRAIKIWEQQPDPCSALGCWHQAGALCPVSFQSTNPAQQLGIPCGQHRVFFKLQGFSKPAVLLLGLRALLQGATAGPGMASAPQDGMGSRSCPVSARSYF